MPGSLAHMLPLSGVTTHTRGFVHGGDAMLIGVLGTLVVLLTVWLDAFDATTLAGGLGFVTIIGGAVLVAGWFERPPARCPHNDLIEWCGPCQAAALSRADSIGEVLHADDRSRREFPRAA